MQHHRISPASRATTRFLAGALVLAWCGAGCVKRATEPFRPPRPWLGPEPSRVRAEITAEVLPERRLFQPRAETPPRTLLRIEEIFRQVGSLPGPEPEWRLPPLRAEIDSIESEFRRIDAGSRGLFRARRGSAGGADDDAARRAALLQIRLGLALMRTGEVNQRVWGAERLREAAEWLPEDPLPTLVYAAYQEIGGFWSNEISLLETWRRRHGPNALIELQLLRKRERQWKVLREREELGRALAIADEMAGRDGGWTAAAPWLSMERARLLFEADSLAAAAVAARRALESCGTPPADTLAAVEAELLLGLLAVRHLEYERAGGHFSRARDLGAADPALGGLISWMQVPWDLWTKNERDDFDHQANGRRWIDGYWRGSDPVLATPDILENRLEYERRVAESWFALSGVDPALPGPLTDPGQALLRFGQPDEWISNSGVSAAGFETLGNDFGINRTWAFRYDVPGAAGGRPLWIVFQDHGSAARFTAVDSMVAPRFPPCFFPQSFAGRAYRYESAATRLRQPDGRTLLLLCYDTLLPDYAVRLPLQGLRFDGSAEVRAALYRARGKSWQASAQRVIVLDREHALSDQWTFRRRSGSAVVADLDAGGARLASRLVLRDSAGSIVGYAVDNGEDGRLDRFSGESLHASDLLFISPFEEALAEVPDRESRAGWKIHGPDLLAGGLEPRASRLFLPGEPIAFYLEVYGLRLQRGLSDAEVTTTLERLRPDGTEDYSITTEGLTQSLVQFEIRQWNVARSLGLTHLQPGYYRLRIGVVDRNADLALERTLVFRVATGDEIAELYAWDRIRPPEPGGRNPSGGAGPADRATPNRASEP